MKDMVAQTPSSVSINNTIKNFIKQKRYLPHWQLPGCVYFITFRTYNSIILEDIFKQIIYDNILHYSKFSYRLYSFVIMPDHVHIILQPNEISKNEFVNLSKIMQSIKGYSAKMIIRELKSQTGASVLPKHIFQPESFDRIIRNDEELYEKMNYILNNPVKCGLIDNGYNYKWYYLNQDETKLLK